MLQQPNFKKVHNTLYLSFLPSIVHAAIEVGIFEKLYSSEQSVMHLSQCLHLDISILETVLEILVHAEFLESEGERYRLTHTTKKYYLKNSEVQQINGLQQFVTGSPFDNLITILREGPPKYIPNRWSNTKAMQQIAQDAKAGSIDEVCRFVKELPNFKTAKSLCDYGGNSGYYSKALLEENTDLQATVFDRPEVCDLATEILEEKFSNRIRYVAYNINTAPHFDQLYDVIFTSHILYHYMGDLEAVGDTLQSMVQKIYSNLKPGGLFVSNHCGTVMNKEDALTNEMMELKVKLSGFPTHKIPETQLIQLLKKNGFRILKTKAAKEGVHYGVFLVAAEKI